MLQLVVTIEEDSSAPARQAKAYRTYRSNDAWRDDFAAGGGGAARVLHPGAARDESRSARGTTLRVMSDMLDKNRKPQPRIETVSKTPIPPASETV